MDDKLHKLMNWISHNRWTSLCVLLLFSLGSIGLVGCESTTASLNDPSVRVTRSEFVLESLLAEKDFDLKRQQLQQAVLELNNQIEKHNIIVESGNTQLDKQDKVITEIFDRISVIAVNVASGGVINPTGAATALVGIGGLLLGVSTLRDNRRKDAKIVELKAGSE